MALYIKSPWRRFSTLTVVCNSVLSIFLKGSQRSGYGQLHAAVPGSADGSPQRALEVELQFQQILQIDLSNVIDNVFVIEQTGVTNAG